MVGALGFEPRLAGVFRLVYAIFITWAFGARGTTRLYYTPVGVNLGEGHALMMVTVKSVSNSSQTYLYHQYDKTD